MQERAVVGLRTASMMVLGLALGCCSGFGQQAPAAACGTPGQMYSVLVKSAALKTLGPEQARIVIAQPGSPSGFNRQTYRVAIDGVWDGAVRDYSWAAFGILPGVHPICVSWESHSGALSRQHTFAIVRTAAGKTSYLELAINGNAGTVTSLDLFAITSDEGKYLMTSLQQVAAQAR